MVISTKWMGMVLSLLTAAASCFGCSGPPSEREVSAEADQHRGQLSLPLATTVGGYTYRLDGYLQVSGPEWQSVYLDYWQDTTSLTLLTGSYNAELYWWNLYREGSNGSLELVNATLLNGPSRQFDILNSTTSTLTFEFETDGEVVTMGSGWLNVEVEVREKPVACTPLGEECGAEAWCAPSELLGAPTQCVPSGSTPLGEPCDSPYECVANASCFDLGAGARCAMLCLAADFGQPCESGGICSSTGMTSGVCVPEPAP